jgi:hypothetical protein
MSSVDRSLVAHDRKCAWIVGGQRRVDVSIGDGVTYHYEGDYPGKAWSKKPLSFSRLSTTLVYFAVLSTQAADLRPPNKLLLMLESTEKGRNSDPASMEESGRFSSDVGGCRMKLKRWVALGHRNIKVRRRRARLF